MSATNMRQHAIALLKRLPQDRLVAVVQLLEFLAQPVPAVDTSEETGLLQVIQWHLPDDEWTRLEKLRDRCEWEQLTEAEHEELIRYEDLLEHQRVERLAALIELAKLKNIDLITLNRQFQSDFQPFHAA